MVHIAKVFFSSLILLIKDSNWRKRKMVFFLLYCNYSLKYIFFWKIFLIPLHEERILGYKLHFFHYSIFLSLFEDMYLHDEYYVELPKNPTIIDLGSEVGLSVFYFKTIYPNARVMAFEPDPASFKLLTQNVKSNNVKKVSCHNLAVANKRGKIPFYIDPVIDGSLTMSLLPARQQKKIMVSVDRLSHVLKQHVDLLKMDIEGAELDVLKDISRSKKIALIDNMIIEYHHHIDDKKNTLSLVLAILEQAGFGYQIQAKYSPPFKQREYQDCLIFAYRETTDIS